MRELDLVQVGAGQVFFGRYLTAMQHLQHERVDVRLTWRRIIDVVPLEKKKPDLLRHGLKERLYAQVEPDCVGAFERVLAELQPASSCVVISTPPQSHVPLALAALRLGFFVALEKPFTSERSHIDRFQLQCSLPNRKRLFCLNYYYLEKALPLFLLRDAPCLAPAQAASLSATHSGWAHIRKALGRLRQINALIIEGHDQRDWSFGLAGGGQTLETFSHLLAITTPFLLTPKVTDVRLARSQLCPFPDGETTSYVRLQGECGATAELALSKWVQGVAEQKWVKLDFENGYAFMDLAAERLVVYGPAGVKSEARVAASAKYLPQFRQLLAQWEGDFDFDTIGPSLGTSLLALAIREQGLAAAILCFSGDPRELAELDQLLNIGEMHACTHLVK